LGTDQRQKSKIMLVMVQVMDIMKTSLMIVMMTLVMILKLNIAQVPHKRRVEVNQTKQSNTRRTPAQLIDRNKDVIMSS